ncbi:ABC-type transport auxiliary lipoprotein family protein [Sphingomonas jatrophae]|uniref:Cholesterol transport system auxiliary component n=1 Tax=Sphingomonas jatrophae TaxID=1166337 RepID=A0A1I6LM62_9SPHN|nr:ABC-type transport auxiliary lipoprotein family protein [Sphingomonas jatrophae]SFS04489.1 cholesterol transport system auxiliary component [Sphingomonas jatrophae]
MRLKPLAAAMPALALAACVSFGAKVPPTLMSLTPAERLAPGTAMTGTDAQAIAVNLPTAPQSLVGLRVPVQASPTAVAYLKDAQWVEPPARLFRHLLAEVVEARTGRVVPDYRQPALAPATRLDGRLQAFGLDAASSSAVVTFDAVLARTGQDQVRTRRFEARVPVTAIDAANAPAALNQAANQVATEVADWIGR